MMSVNCKGVTLLPSRPPLWYSGVLWPDSGLLFSLLWLLESLSLMISYCLQKRAITAVSPEITETQIRFHSIKLNIHPSPAHHNWVWKTSVKENLCFTMLENAKMFSQCRSARFEGLLRVQHKLSSIDGVCGIMSNTLSPWTRHKSKLFSVGIDNVPRELWIKMNVYWTWSAGVYHDSVCCPKI